MSTYYDKFECCPVESKTNGYIPGLGFRHFEIADRALKRLKELQQGQLELVRHLTRQAIDEVIFKLSNDNFEVGHSNFKGQSNSHGDDRISETVERRFHDSVLRRK